VLVIDIGGSRVKLFAHTVDEPSSFTSGPRLEPDDLVDNVRQLTHDWHYDAVSIGYPGSTGPHGPTAEPGNLGNGWVGYDFSRAFGCPVRIVNDAAMQALGVYDGGRMLFLGLGTGLGSAIIAERVIVRLELGCLRHVSGATLAERLGKSGMAQADMATWQDDVRDAAALLRDACAADYVVLGGGNAKLVDPLPERTRRGSNDDAFTGGFRLWADAVEHHDAPASDIWRVVW
jgi:polyphosphate glucokinase